MKPANNGTNPRLRFRGCKPGAMDASCGMINPFPYGGITRIKSTVEVRDFLSALPGSRSVVPPL